jgi:hypothetical protein
MQVLFYPRSKLWGSGTARKAKELSVILWEILLYSKVFQNSAVFLGSFGQSEFQMMNDSYDLNNRT